MPIHIQMQSIYLQVSLVEIARIHKKIKEGGDFFLIT